MRRISQATIAFFALLGTSACVPPGHVDITVFLKNMNQAIAPVGLSCPQWHYPAGSTVMCSLENASARREIAVVVADSGISFADQVDADRVIAELR